MGKVLRSEFDENGNLLKTIEDFDGLALTQSYAHDALNRSVAYTNARTHAERYLYDGLGRLDRSYNAQDKLTQYRFDALGRSTKTIRPSLAEEFAYMPYGYASHVAHSNSVDTSFQWLGGYGVYYDSDTDLHLTLHRAYSSNLKRFLQPDPLGIDGGVNIYAYANLNPIYYADPSGEIPVPLITGGIGALIGGGIGFFGELLTIEPRANQ